MILLISIIIIIILSTIILLFLGYIGKDLMTFKPDKNDDLIYYNEVVK